MKVITCAPKGFNFKDYSDTDLNVVLYSYSESKKFGQVGQAVKDKVRALKLVPESRAWDFLSIALSVIAADKYGERSASPDGWTRQFKLRICVADSKFWKSQKVLIERLLGFLTTDMWQLEFLPNGFLLAPPTIPKYPKETSVTLLSGGLDSFIGLLDLIKNGEKPYVVSQTVRGDAVNQQFFAQSIAKGFGHFQVNHNCEVPSFERPASQRARSIIFIAYGILISSCLKKYKDGQRVKLYLCENGFISLNPPLTGMRIGSLSTRTTNPIFIGYLQELLDKAKLNIEIVNPYQFKTKGEMLKECKDQKFLQPHAANTTSCGRYTNFGYKHCGRCIPCLIRRASFKAWGKSDLTEYVFTNLSKDDEEHAKFDDVRSAAMAVAKVKADGFDAWLGGNLNSALLGDTTQYKAVIKRGLKELEVLLSEYKVR